MYSYLTSPWTIGVGLNLTRANNVISLDLGWSQAVEAQAFDRVHRLGQNRPVKVDRLVISDTVEDRILALQERKRNLADGSLGEGNGKKIGSKYLVMIKSVRVLINSDRAERQGVGQLVRPRCSWQAFVTRQIVHKSTNWTISLLYSLY